MLDWVANHTAFDHHWVTEHPEFYTADSLGNRPVVAIDNEGKPTDWTDVADLDYTNKDLWPAMTEEMRFWLTDCNIDGFRCDVAGFVPVEFWNQAVASLKETNPELFMLMEWEDPKYMSAFNMGYGWELHHLMNEVAKGDTTPEVFTTFKEKFDTTFNADDMLMYFTTNHDENAWNGTIEERMGANGKSMFVFATTFMNGMPLIYSGQEAGLNKRLAFFKKDTIQWEDMRDSLFYAGMLKLKHDNPSLWNGKYGGKMHVITTSDNPYVYSFYREKGENKVIVILNFGEEDSDIDLSAKEIQGTYKLHLEGVNYGEFFDINLSDSTSIGVGSNGYLILVKSR
jgi:glycosidase